MTEYWDILKLYLPSPWGMFFLIPFLIKTGRGVPVIECKFSVWRANKLCALKKLTAGDLGTFFRLRRAAYTTWNFSNVFVWNQPKFNIRQLKNTLIGFSFIFFFSNFFLSRHSRLLIRKFSALIFNLLWCQKNKFQLKNYSYKSLISIKRIMSTHGKSHYTVWSIIYYSLMTQELVYNALYELDGPKVSRKVSGCFTYLSIRWKKSH